MEVILKGYTREGKRITSYKHSAVDINSQLGLVSQHASETASCMPETKKGRFSEI